MWVLVGGIFGGIEEVLRGYLMALSDPKIRGARPREKAYKLADGAGLYLLVTPDGAKYWRLKYRYAGKEKLLALGVYPKVRAPKAREKRDEAKQILSSGRDPSAARKEEKRILSTVRERTFEPIARAWLDPKNRQNGKLWTKDHADRVRESLEDDVFPDLGFRPIAEITAPELLAVLRKIQARGALETAQRVLQRCRAVFGFAMAHGLCPGNPAAEAELHKLLRAPERKNRPALAEADLPEFLAKLEAYDGHELTKLAIRLLLLTFVRPGELRFAEWIEFDEKAAEWRIPAERMKMRAPHTVPMSRQALQLLDRLRPLSGGGRYLFPGQGKPRSPMSENTILYALYRMGYHSRATGHGFRATASSILNEQGWKPDAIERQLAHVERNRVRAAYHRSEYMDERRKMMQAWADYLDAVAAGGKVMSIKRAA